MYLQPRSVNYYHLSMQVPVNDDDIVLIYKINLYIKNKIKMRN